MPAEFNLPSELNELELQLCQLPVPPSAVARDEVLYRAGWAAAETQLLRPTTTSGWLWPATSGVLAASVLVLSFMLVKQLDQTATLAVVTEPAVEPAVESEVEPLPVPQQPVLRHPNRWQHTAPLLAMREAAFRMEFTDPVPTPLTNDEYEVSNSTRRELMYELLPELQPTNSPTAGHTFWHMLLGGTS